MLVGSGLGKLGIPFCRSNRGMAQKVFNRHQGNTSFQHMCGGGMPLWHNKDKSENPCGATGWLVCPYSFSIKNDPQIGSAGVSASDKMKENAEEKM